MLRLHFTNCVLCHPASRFVELFEEERNGLRTKQSARSCSWKLHNMEAWGPGLLLHSLERLLLPTACSISHLKIHTLDQPILRFAFLFPPTCLTSRREAATKADVARVLILNGTELGSLVLNRYHLIFSTFAVANDSTTVKFSHRSIRRQLDWDPYSDTIYAYLEPFMVTFGNHREPTITN
jgi:hypothetical protein